MKTDNTVLLDSLSRDYRFEVGNREEKTFFIYLSNHKNLEGNLEIKIKGSNAKVNILGLILGTGVGTIRLNTLQDHLKPSSISDLFIKSVLFDKSHFYYQGLIKIGKNAQKSNAYQKNQNLLMSRGAWADSRPKLEILANDVRCTHGATIGKIDESQLYYLSCRGLNKTQATGLIVEGYCLDVVNRIQDDRIKNEITLDIKKQLNKEM